jgi:hypothetical protein
MRAAASPAWIVAAPPGAPGAFEALGAAPASGVRVLLVGEGLAWLTPEALLTLRRLGPDLALCSASARDLGLDASRTPAGVRWSSVATWMAELEGRPFDVLLP